MASTRHPRARSTRLPAVARVRAVRAFGTAAAVALGVAAAVYPMLALVGFVALVVVVACLPRGELAVAAFAATTYFEVLGSAAITPVKLLGGIVVASGALLLLVRTARGRSELPRYPWYVVSAIVLVAWAGASSAWAVDLAQVRTNGVRLLMDVLVLLVVPMLLRRTGDLRMLGWCAVVASLGGAALGRVLGHEFGGRAVGMFSDPNEYAAATVVGAAFAIALGESSDHRVVRWFGRLASCACLVAVVTSASRTGVAAAIVVLFVLLLTARGAERVRFAGVAAVGIAAAAAWVMLSPGGIVVGERLSGEDSTGRTDLWRVARYQFADEPVHGVGLGNYPVVSIRYLRGDVQNLDLFIRMPRTVHNTPLELLAELGVVGFTAFYLVVLGCLGTLVRALRRARAVQDAALVGACRGMLAGMLALLASSLTLSALYVELQWILFGACIAAAEIARRARTPHERELDEAGDAELAWAGLLDPDDVELGLPRPFAAAG